MKFIFKIIKDFPWFLWSGWGGAIASILLFIALWDIGNQVYGNLVLPSPLETFSTLSQMLNDEAVHSEIKITVYRALVGFIISFIIGTCLGLLAGLFTTASIMSRPIVTILVGMPPIAWIVLAMIWFGMGDTTVIFTVVVASFPIVFVGALQGTRTIEGNLKEMVESFHLSFFFKSLQIFIFLIYFLMFFLHGLVL